MYETLTVSNHTTLLANLVTFAVANGWTVNTDQVEGLGRRVTLSKIPGMFVHLRSFSYETSIIGNINTSVNSGIGFVVSQTNNTTSINSNAEYAVINGMLPINHTLPVTYHFFSTSDGNSIAIAAVTSMISNPSMEVAVFAGFGTSINKTTTVNDTWYVYSHGANDGNNVLNSQSSCDILEGGRQCFLISGSGSANYNYPQFGMYSTTSFFGGINNLYFMQSQVGTYGILNHSGTRSVGVGSYDYLRSNSASTAFANTTLIPSNIFMKHPSSGFNLIGTVPMLWLHNAVPLLYRNGQIVPMNGKNYAMFAYHAYEVIN